MRVGSRVVGKIRDGSLLGFTGEHDDTVLVGVGDEQLPTHSLSAENSGA
jgi:hypothetical protein